MINKKTEIPANSLLRDADLKFNYVDSFQGTVLHNGSEATPVEFLKLFICGGPVWVDKLLNIRDKVAKLFGLKTADKAGCDFADTAGLTIGQQLGLFKLFDQSDSEYILGEDDKHLNFRVSLLIAQSDMAMNEKILSITTAVCFNNFFGRLYFLPVKPFHQFIVRASLRRIVKTLNGGNQLS